MSLSVAAKPTAGAPLRSRWWVLGALACGLLVMGLDITVLNVALPTLATSLDASTAQLQWIVDAYVLVLAGAILPLGALADRWGRRRMLLAGLAAFAAGSLVAALATSVATLVAARAFMGLGAAAISGVTLAVLPVLFGPAERQKAIAYVTMALGAGIPLGPIVGGWLLDRFWWGSVFVVNVPVAVAAAVAVAVLLPESRDPHPTGADPLGGLLSTTGLVAVVYGVVEAPLRGWTDGLVVSVLVTGVLLLGGFVAWERRWRSPMIDLGLFRRPRFLWGTAAATTAAFALFGLLFVLPLYFQAVRGHDPMGTGLRILPMMGGLIVGAKAGETLAARRGVRVPVAAGLFLVAAALAGGAATGTGTAYGWIAAWTALVGAGTGMAMAPAMDAVLGELPPERAGSGSALSMTLRQVGGALGVAVLGSIASTVYGHRLDTDGLPAAAASAASKSVSGAVEVAARLGDAGLAAAGRTAYTEAMAAVLLFCAAVAAVGGLLVAVLLPARGGATSPDGIEDRIDA
jgi:EmrB/QacA subfamily drug resistance transporter